MKAIFSKLERVPLRNAWKHDSQEFTPWLAESQNLALLAGATGRRELARGTPLAQRRANPMNLLILLIMTRHLPIRMMLIRLKW